MTALIVFAVVAVLLLVGGVALLLVSNQVGKAGRVWWLVAGIVLIVAALALGAWALVGAMS